MLLLLSGATATARKHADSPYLGWLLTPRSGNDVAKFGLPWAMDNDCYQALDRKAFITMLKRWQAHPGCLWVVAPDVFGNAQATLLRFKMWQPAIKYYGYPVAFVTQDGLENFTSQIPWDDFDCLFLGGNDKFRFENNGGQFLRDLCREAKSRGKLIHMGRCNSRTRMLYAGLIGCDSVDGSGFSRYANEKLAWGLRQCEIVETWKRNTSERPIALEGGKVLEKNLHIDTYVQGGFLLP